MATLTHARVGVIVGSLRRESISRRIAHALVDRAPAALDFDWIEIGDLPLYTQDLDEDPPQEWTRFRSAVSACDALLFVTPEYNRSIPGALKNATDIGSRPDEEANVFDGLPAAVVSVSPYAPGGMAANHALRQNFVYINLRTMAQPEAYIGAATEIVDEDGTVPDTEADQRLTDFMTAFAEWIALAGADRLQGDDDLDEFLIERERASNAYISGDFGPLSDIVTAHDPATFFPPNGARVVGADAAASAQREGAAAFAPGSAGRFEVLSSGSSAGLAWWAGVQHATVHTAEGGDPVPMRLRTTEVFRREDGRWRLVHRHADMIPPDQD